MELDFKLEDADQALKKLETFPKKLKRKALRAAARQGAKVWQQAARKLAEPIDDPWTEMKISRFIAVGENTKLGKREGGIAMRVGVRGGAAAKKGEPRTPWYWRFLEFGTQKQSAQPFMRPAMENNLQTATDAVAQSLKPAIDKIAREKP